MCDVIVDADFARCLLGIDDTGRLIPRFDREIIFIDFFNRIGRTPVFNSYVFNNELVSLHKSTGRCLHNMKSSGAFKVYEFSDYLASFNNPSDENMLLYEVNFKTSYKLLNASSFPESENIFSFTNSGCSIGEIHSILMAQEMGCDLFCSNDGGSKTIVEKVLLGKSITVVTIVEALKDLRSHGKEFPMKYCKTILSGLCQKTKDLYFKSK